ncbi:MAG: glycosyltransferase [Pyrinomonadaceae bacterium]|nr:glycosyltransferase [Pyrinomonadaceae bacterium]
MLEAMVMGAFPIQSDTLSTAEWIKHGENGLLVRPDDPESIGDAIRRALIEDDLVDRAADFNTTITQQIDRTIIKPKVVDLYRKVAADIRPAGGSPLIAGTA